MNIYYAVVDLPLQSVSDAKMQLEGVRVVPLGTSHAGAALGRFRLTAFSAEDIRYYLSRIRLTRGAHDFDEATIPIHFEAGSSPTDLALAR